MYESLKQGRVVSLPEIHTFVDGAAVRTVGRLTFDLCRKYVDRVVVIPEGKVCTTMIELYQNEGIISEPAGALSLSALDDAAGEIKGKTVVCILSGGNNDILRYACLIAGVPSAGLKIGDDRDFPLCRHVDPPPQPEAGQPRR